jgi:hypothetical protein
MNTQRRFHPSLFLLITMIGLLAGGAIVQKNTHVAEAASREQGLVAVQSARGAMDVIKDDMARAGYAEARPASHAVSNHGAARVSPADELRVTKAFGKVLAFRAPNGDEIVYALSEGKLIRAAKGQKEVLVGNAADFKVRSVDEGETVDLAFWIPVGSPADSKANQAPAYAHFVRAGE